MTYPQTVTNDGSNVTEDLLTVTDDRDSLRDTSRAHAPLRGDVTLSRCVTHNVTKTVTEKASRLNASVENRSDMSFASPTLRHVTAQVNGTKSIRCFAIDPGTTESGWVLFENDQVVQSGVDSNHDLLTWVKHGQHADVLAIEMMKARGMPTSNDEFRTLVWIGRFTQAWREPEAVQLVYRMDVKIEICGHMKAKDANITQALLDRIGPKGTKASPGPCYGMKSHAWAALGVAVTCLERMGVKVQPMQRQLEAV